MALPLQNSFDSGLADGTAVTTANSAVGGNAFDLQSIGAGNTQTYESDHVAHGTQAQKFVLAASAHPETYVAWTTSIEASVTESWGRVYLYRTANPVSSHNIVRCYDSSSVIGAFIRITSTGKVSALDNLSAGVTGAVSIALSVWIRLEWHLLSSATVGQFGVKLFNTADATSPDETIGDVATNLNTKADMKQVRVGIAGALDNGGVFYIDDLLANKTGYPGPSTTPAVPTLFLNQGNRW
jgi:hypothetical protein